MSGQEMLEDSEVRGVNTNYVEQDCHFSIESSFLLADHDR